MSRQTDLSVLTFRMTRLFPVRAGIRRRIVDGSSRVDPVPVRAGSGFCNEFSAVNTNRHHSKLIVVRLTNEPTMRSEKLTFPNDCGALLSGRLDVPVDGEPVAFVLFAHCFTCSKNLNAVMHISRSLTRTGIGVLRFDFTEQA